MIPICRVNNISNFMNITPLCTGKSIYMVNNFQKYKEYKKCGTNVRKKIMTSFFILIATFKTILISKDTRYVMEYIYP